MITSNQVKSNKVGSRTATLMIELSQYIELEIED